MHHGLLCRVNSEEIVSSDALIGLGGITLIGGITWGLIERILDGLV